MIATYGGASLVRDRFGGQLRRLLAAPVPRMGAYGGKVLARVLLGVVQAGVVLVGGATLFRVPMGDHPLFLVPVVLCLALFAGCLSLEVGLLCRSEKQVIVAAIFAGMLLSALGGCWWPIELVPDSLKTVAMFLPSYWAMHGLQSILYFGRSYEVLMLECPVLLGFAALLAALALLTARKQAKGGRSA